jgi:ribosomal-protein-alanine N-acetyltransferase
MSNFTVFPILSTQRLNLRRPRREDAPALFAIKSDPQLTAQYGQEPHPSIDTTRAWVERLRVDFDQRQALFWCLTLKNDETAIGAGGFWNFDPDYHYAEIGYELHPDYWGQGLMGEALGAMLAYGFEELALHRIEANPLSGNTGSQHLLEKLGFRLEGTLRQRHYFRGAFLDQLYYGLLRDEWLNRKEREV